MCFLGCQGNVTDLHIPTPFRYVDVKNKMVYLTLAGRLSNFEKALCKMNGKAYFVDTLRVTDLALSVHEQRIMTKKSLSLRSDASIKGICLMDHCVLGKDTLRLYSNKEAKHLPVVVTQFY